MIISENQKICIKKRMEPMILPSALKRKSWDTLPLLTMELTVERNPLNRVHHQVLQKANWMKLTLIAAYNMIIPFESDYVYTAASKIPSHNDDDAVRSKENLNRNLSFFLTPSFCLWAHFAYYKWRELPVRVNFAPGSIDVCANPFLFQIILRKY